MSIYWIKGIFWKWIYRTRKHTQTNQKKNMHKILCKMAVKSLWFELVKRFLFAPFSYVSWFVIESLWCVTLESCICINFSWNAFNQMWWKNLFILRHHHQSMHTERVVLLCCGCIYVVTVSLYSDCFYCSNLNGIFLSK